MRPHGVALVFLVAQLGVEVRDDPAIRDQLTALLMVRASDLSPSLRGTK